MTLRFGAGMDHGCQRPITIVNTLVKEQRMALVVIWVASVLNWNPNFGRIHNLLWLSNFELIVASVFAHDLYVALRHLLHLLVELK